MKKSLAAVAVGMAAFALISGPAQAVAAPKAGGVSITLFDKANFSEDSIAEGHAGKGCQPVLTQNDQTSSVRVFGGTVVLWSELNCKGQSVKVSGDVPNLADKKFDFDNKTSSIFLG